MKLLAILAFAAALPIAAQVNQSKSKPLDATFDADTGLFKSSGSTVVTRLPWEIELSTMPAVWMKIYGCGYGFQCSQAKIELSPGQRFYATDKGMTIARPGGLDRTKITIRRRFGCGI